VINYPTRGIGKTTIERMTVIANEKETSLWNICENIHQTDITGKAAQNISAFTYMIKSFQAMLEKQNAFDLASHIAKSSGILKELYDDKTIEGVMRYENIQELLNGIKEFCEEDTVEEGAGVSMKIAAWALICRTSLCFAHKMKNRRMMIA
jgi:DNA helicase-2/ATP-dependent DNA helicase PcrA